MMMTMMMMTIMMVSGTITDAQQGTGMYFEQFHLLFRKKIICVFEALIAYFTFIVRLYTLQYSFRKAYFRLQ